MPNLTTAAAIDLFMTSATQGAARTNLALIIGTDVQPFDADLSLWAAITPGTGVGTMLATFSSANIAAACTDETGFSSGALIVFNKSPTIDAPNFTGTTTVATLNATTGNITAGTITGTMLLAEGGNIALDPAGSADGAWSGITMTGTSGYAQAFGDLVMFDPNQSPGRWELASVSAAAGAVGDCRGNLAMVVVAATDGNTCTLLRIGNVRSDANFPSLTVNGAAYATTTGDITNTQPSTTDHVIRIVGEAITADEIFFNPSSYWETHT